MLHCADRSFYVGHTDDLEKRMGQHEQGLMPGYTSERLPVKLVWTQDFATRDEAREAEAQLKGWGRAKKLALIQGDWARISNLAKGKVRASTSSAKSGVFAAELFLHPHLGSIPSEPFSLQACLRFDAERLLVRFRLTGLFDRLVIPAPSSPAPASPRRRDELWRHTCFEIFVKLDEEPGYVEYNFSPSGDWAAYRFADYRSEMTSFDADAPRTRCKRMRYALELTAAVQMPRSFKPTRLGISAVIEESCGRKSYWALVHPAAKPDFHHPDSFVIQLPEVQ